MLSFHNSRDAEFTFHFLNLSSDISLFLNINAESVCDE